MRKNRNQKARTETNRTRLATVGSHTTRYSRKPAVRKSGPRCALYARSATEVQNDNGVDKQLATLREQASTLGCKIVAEYSDRAMSGSSVQRRDGILRLIDDAKHGKFEVVMIGDLDRISRDIADAQYFLQLTQSHKVKIYSSADKCFLDAVSVAFRGFGHREFTSGFASRVRRGQQEAIHAGRAIGRPPYGYRLAWTGTPPKSAWEIDPEQSQVVQRIFSEFAAGRSVRDIVRELNSEGIPYSSSHRRVWSTTHILGSSKGMRGIMGNSLYRGVYVWGKTNSHRSPDDGRRISTAAPECDRISSDWPHLRIVEDSVWNAVQQRLALCRRRDM